jgi:hypothetical protein
VEDVFPLSFLAGPIVWGTFTGAFRPGDRVTLERPDGTTAEGHVILVDRNRPRDARPDQIGTAIGGDVAEIVRPGDLLAIFPPEDA